MEIEEEVLMENQTTETINISKIDVVVQCSLLKAYTISLPLRCITSSYKYGVICHFCFGSKTFIVISENIWLTASIQRAIYLLPSVRYCDNHLSDYSLESEALSIIKDNYSPITSIAADDVITIIRGLTSYVKELTAGTFIQEQSSISFDSPLQYSDNDYYVLTGIYKSDFDTLCQQVEMRSTDNRSISRDISYLLAKLQIELSNQASIALFSIDDRRTITHIIESAGKALMKYFVPSYLGIHRVSHETIAKYQTRLLAKQLLTDGNNVAILALDATYLHVQKSANNTLQRKLFSLHKNRPLIKLMIIVATDGYIVSVIEP